MTGTRLFILLGILTIASAVETITHRAQLYTCINICHQEVTNCIRPDTKCIKSYRTCLEKAKDTYKCFNSSKLKEMKQLTSCIRKKCPEVKEQPITELINPYFRYRHTVIALCAPWDMINTSVARGFVPVSKKYQQCQRVRCRVKESPATKDTNKMRQQQAKKKKNGVCKRRVNRRIQISKACGLQDFGQNGRSAVFVLQGWCLMEN